MCLVPIPQTNGTSNGLIPMLRVFNNTARYVDQGGNKVALTNITCCNIHDCIYIMSCIYMYMYMHVHIQYEYKNVTLPLYTTFKLYVNVNVG